MATRGRGERATAATAGSASRLTTAAGGRGAGGRADRNARAERAGDRAIRASCVQPGQVLGRDVRLDMDGAAKLDERELLIAWVRRELVELSRHPNLHPADGERPRSRSIGHDDG